MLRNHLQLEVLHLPVHQIQTPQMVTDSYPDMGFEIGPNQLREADMARAG